MNASTIARASASVCMRPPMPISCALLCWRPTRGLDAPRQSTPRAGHLVRGDLLAVAAAAEHNAQAARVRRQSALPRRCRRRDSRRARRRCSHRNRRLRGRPQVVGDLVLQFEAGMVGAQVDTHGATIVWRACLHQKRPPACLRRFPPYPGSPPDRPRAHQLPPDAHWLPPAGYADRPRRHPGRTRCWSSHRPHHHRNLMVILVVARGLLSAEFLSILALPLFLVLGRGITYASPRVNGVQLTPTQFPEPTGWSSTRRRGSDSSTSPTPT